jgi:hypothetical protein
MEAQVRAVIQYAFGLLHDAACWAMLHAQDYHSDSQQQQMPVHECVTAF